MSGDCPTCAALQSQVAELHAQVGQLVGGIQSTLAMIDSEQDERTMSTVQLIRSIQARLGSVLNSTY